MILVEVPREVIRRLQAELAEARAQIAAKDAALRRIEVLTYSEGVEGDALDMATEIARAALAQGVK